MIDSFQNRSGLTMKKFTGASAAALLVAAMSMPAAAQSLDVGANLDTGVTVGSDDPAANANTGVDAEVDVNAGGDAGVSLTADGSAQVDTSFQFDEQGGDGAYDLHGILSLNTQSNLGTPIDTNKIAFADIDDDLDPQAHLDLMTSLESDTSVDQIRAAAGASAELSAVLEAEGYEARDVVGLEIGNDGATMIYVADGILNPSCDVVAAKHNWAEIEEVEAATGASVVAAGDCETGNFWINGDIKSAAMANAMIASELEAGGFKSEDILAVELVSSGHVSIFIDDHS